MDRRGALLDAIFFGVSALVAFGVWGFASIPIQREWAVLAAPVYAGGAVLALLVTVIRASTGVRAGLTIALIVAVALLPLGVQTFRRAATDPSLHAQAEVIVTEEAARAALRGESPYAAAYGDGPLAGRPAGTRTHFPYFPGMLVFGLPRGAGGPLPAADARVAFAVASAAALAVALLRWRTRTENRLRMLQVVAVLPTTAVLLPTGGDDVPVVALMLLSAVLAFESRPGIAGAVAGFAAAVKQTAWFTVPFLALAARDELGRARPGRFLGPAVLVPLAVTMPFVAWDPSAFVRDTILFPLGMSDHPSPAATPTIGRLLTDAFPGVREPLTAGLVAASTAMGVWLLLRGPRTVPAALASAGVLFLGTALLAPVARLGYLIYPLNLVVWAWLMRSGAGGPGDSKADRSQAATLESGGRSRGTARLLGPGR